MGEGFDEHVVTVSPDNPCDVCGNPAKFYCTLYYIHICSEKCYNVFTRNVDEEINRIAITRLKGKKLNGTD